jgi:phytoene dehydrogenase-like protein
MKPYEVVVVGGGIGGLTTAAVLAHRGVSVCLLERQSHVGGCLANFEHLGYEFEPAYGLYRGFGSGEVFDRLFSEIGVPAPAVRKLSPAYAVRLPDGAEISVSTELDEFERSLRTVFPECSDAALRFYRSLEKPSQAHASTLVSSNLENCSVRFRLFVDAQLQNFLQRSSDTCPVEYAADLLSAGGGFWSIEGGAQRLADALADSIKQSGGTVRLNAPVLRLAYGPDEQPMGVDLLNGEQIEATKAIVSNLTVWDTCGKLIGLRRTPREVASVLRGLRSFGAYLLFLSMDREAVPRLSSSRMLALIGSPESEQNDPLNNQLFFSCNSESTIAPPGKVPVTVTTLTNAEDWFSFHEDQSAHEKQDQQMLEAVWSRLHASIPELGDSVEVIETANPQTFYETTRRKFGMIGRPDYSTEVPSSLARPLHKVFIVSDTNTSGFGVASLAEAALRVSDVLTENS